MLIRSETAADFTTISRVNYQAFKNHPHHKPGAEPTEQLIVERLRADNALTLSLVAEIDHQIVGHIAISPVTIASGQQHWYGLGPVAVLPAVQGQGIGSSLIRKAIDTMIQRGAEGIVVLGEPGYYNRFGFKVCDAITLPGVPAEYFMAITLKDTSAEGHIAYHPAFQ
ncbi:GNAT family N-acetyltransferase [Spongorhabdus nitratireducens]